MLELRAAGRVGPHSPGRGPRVCVHASERARGSGPRRVVCARPAVGRVRVRAERENRPPPALELAARRAQKVSERQGEWGGRRPCRRRGGLAGVVLGPTSAGTLLPPGRRDAGGEARQQKGGSAHSFALHWSVTRVAPQATAPLGWGLRNEHLLDPVPSKSVLIKAWNTENIKELR